MAAPTGQRAGSGTNPLASAPGLPSAGKIYSSTIIMLEVRRRFVGLLPPLATPWPRIDHELAGRFARHVLQASAAIPASLTLARQMSDRTGKRIVDIVRDELRGGRPTS